MKKNKIDFETQVQIKKYLNFIWDNEEKRNNKNESELFSKLSNHLKYQFLLQTNGKFLLTLNFFSENFSRELLNKLMFLMKSITFDPNSIVYQVLINLIKKLIVIKER